MNRTPIIVMVTAPSRDTGQQIAAALLEQNLAACINILSPILSMYTWKGETVTDEEALLVIKSWSDLFENNLIPAIQAIHPNEVPEILALPVWKGVQSYLDWMEEVTQKLD